MKVERGEVEYKEVVGSRGPRRDFKITWGLSEGYAPHTKIHSVEEVISFVEEHLKTRAAKGMSYLTGSITTGVVVYAWPDGKGQAGGGHEPVVMYGGEVSHLYNSGLSDDVVRFLLDEMAIEIGRKLGQNRVYVAYRDEVWVFQKEEETTPTGETV
jgi:hypothetical protein